jgi:prevent-host-death family protein
MRTESLRQVRDHLSEVVDRVQHEHERVTLTRNGRPAAVLISPDDLAQLEETLDPRRPGGAGGDSRGRRRLRARGRRPWCRGRPRAAPVTAAEEPYELILTPPVVRALRTRLPEPVAAAVIEFLTGSLIQNPRRVGKPLRGDLAGVRPARHLPGPVPHQRQPARGRRCPH